MKGQLDEFDLKLLDALQRNSRLTADELAKQVSLSPSSVQRRLRRLRAERIIDAEVAIILPDTVGRNLTVIVEVTLDTDRSKADFVLIVTAKDMQDYEEFADRFLARRRHVKHFHTSVVMRRVKWGVTVPVNRKQM